MGKCHQNTDDPGDVLDNAGSSSRDPGRTRRSRAQREGFLCNQRERLQTRPRGLPFLCKAALGLRLKPQGRKLRETLGEGPCCHPLSWGHRQEGFRARKSWRKAMHALWHRLVRCCLRFPAWGRSHLSLRPHPSRGLVLDLGSLPPGSRACSLRSPRSAMPFLLCGRAHVPISLTCVIQAALQSPPAQASGVSRPEVLLPWPDRCQHATPCPLLPAPPPPPSHPASPLGDRT